MSPIAEATRTKDRIGGPAASTTDRISSLNRLALA